MIPDETIDEIRSRVDIVAVIGHHVQLKKAGRNWKGLCPFHGEKTPSFNVSPDKGFFYCFGCQKKGDAFTFVMEYEGKSFLEAAEQLAAATGIELPQIEENPLARRARSERAQMLEVNKIATAFFREVLADPTRGAAGKAYLERRGMRAEICDRFQLGYAPADWHALADHLKAKRVDMEVAVKLGLVSPQPRAGGFYDRFRDRLVCPVVVPGGEVAGFSARLVGDGPAHAAGRENDGVPAAKYINSPESPVYKKSKILFGLAQAREAVGAKKRAIMVEGNFDVIAMHQAGFAEAVAPLGTALTHEQVDLLHRLTQSVILLYDGDRAGYAATLNALELCTEVDLEVRVASRAGNAKSGGSGRLADGDDPDSLLARGGTEAMSELLQHAQGGVEYFAFEVWSRAKSSVDARTRALDHASRLLAKVANPTKRDLIIGTLATAMELDEGVVRHALERARTERERAGVSSSQAGRNGVSGGTGAHGQRGPTAGGHPNDPRHERGDQARGDGAGASPGTEAGAVVYAGPPATEEVEVVALLADHPSIWPNAESLGVFSLLTDGRLRDMYSAARAGQRLVELAPLHLPTASAELVLSAKYAAESNPKLRLEQMAANLRHRGGRVELAQLNARLAEAQRRGDSELARQLAQQLVSARVTTRKQVD